MKFQLVSLLSCLLVVSVRGIFPGLGLLGGGLGGGYPMAGGFNQQGGYATTPQQQVDPNMMTCIGADAQDPQSQIRLTIRPLQGQNGAFGPLGMHGMHPMGLGFGNTMGQINPDQPMDWTVDGMLLPSQVVQKAGTYEVGVFEGGRTHGQCKASALGRVLGQSPQGQFGSPFGMGPFSPLHMSPFGSLFGNMYGGMGGIAGHQRPPGILSNNAIVGTGTTMYSGMIQGLSKNQLMGHSVGVCPGIQSQCVGAVVFCCSIVADTLPANDVFVDPVVTTTTGLGGVAGVPGVGGVGLGLANGGVPGVGMGVPVGNGLGVGTPGLVGVGAQTGLVGAGVGVPLGDTVAAGFK